MRELGIKVLRRSIPVAIVLAIMGYAFAELFLLLHRTNGGIPDPANNSARWRAPLMMAGIGIGLQLTIELFLYVIRRKRPANPISSNASTIGDCTD